MDEIPNEIGTKICSYLPLADRVRLGQIIPSWITWAGLREIVIDDLFSSDAAVIELLEKCGGQLEEITSQQNLPQTYGGKLFGHFCPKLRNLSFTSASSFCFTELPNDLQRENFHNEIDRLFSSLTQLKRLEILQPIKHWNLISDGFLSAADILWGLRCVSTLVELSIANWHGIWHENHLIGDLQQLEVLSLGLTNIYSSLVDQICRLSHLRELNLQFHSRIDLDDHIVESICNSVMNLECLVVANFGWIPAISSAPQIFASRLSKLKIFVFVAIMTKKTHGPVVLSRASDHLLNVFVNEEIFHLFMSESDFISIISMPNQRRGEAAQFLHKYASSNSDLKDFSILKMLIRSNRQNGELDLYLSDGDWTSCRDFDESSNW